jgi:hypothetical protein
MGSRARACGRWGRAALTAGLLALPAALPAAAQDAAGEAAGLAIVADDERPLRGQVVRLTVTEGGRPAAGARVTALYRPNSQTQHEAELAPVDSSGTVLWTPEYTGPVTLEVRPAGTPSGGGEPPAAAALTVAVRYGSLPASGLFIMVLAGVLLFGGAAWAMILLLRPPDHIPEAEPPST